MKVILVSLLMLGLAWAADLTCKCGWRNGGRLLGGRDTMKNEFPWMVALRTKTDRFTFCGGSIVTPWHVVTAASCVIDHSSEDLMLIIGAYDVHSISEGTSQLHFVSEIISHPGFDNEKNLNDIAIVVTEKEIEINQYVGPACMPAQPLGKMLTDKMVKAMGWGKYDLKTKNVDKVKKLKQADFKVVNDEVCNTPNSPRLCTFSIGRSTCLGDTGGPLVWLHTDTNRFTLVGVISTPPPECDYKKSPGINTDVSGYMDWITEVIERSKPEAQICTRA